MALGHLLAAFFVCGVHQVLVSVIFGHGGVQLRAFYLLFGVAVVGLHFFVEIHLTNIVQNVAYSVHIVKDLFNIFVGNKSTCAVASAQAENSSMGSKQRQSMVPHRFITESLHLLEKGAAWRLQRLSNSN